MTSRRRAGTSAPLSRAVLVAVPAVASWALLRLGGRMPPAARAPFERTNHAGRVLTLLEGPAWVGGAVAGTAASGLLRHGDTDGWAPHPRLDAASLVAALGAGALGAVDDLAGGAADKGLKGHLAALARGEVTTGAVKIVGLGACGLLAAALSDSARTRRLGSAGGTAGPGALWSVEAGPSTGLARILTTAAGGAVIAGAANAVNLFDLRPGRALKVTVTAALPLSGSGAGAAALGASLGVLHDDLRASSMLGDTGANAAGSLLGLALVERTGLRGRAVALAGLAALTLVSERVSFTRVIEGNAVLRRLDEWGRQPR